VGTVPVDSGPVKARLIGRTGETLLVAHSQSPYLAVVDARSLTLRQRVYVGSGARALEVDPRGGRIYLARARTGRIEAFDPSSFLTGAESPVPGEVVWMSIETEGNGLGVLLRDAPEARIVGLVGNDTVTRTPLGADPAALEFVQGRPAP